MVILHDGRILSGSEDETLRIWNSTTGECVKVVEGHKGLTVYDEIQRGVCTIMHINFLKN